MMNKIYTKVSCLLILLLGSTFAFCQESNEKPKGEVYGDVFLNANYNLTDNYASFRLNRLHVGYKRDLSENFYFNGMFESALEDYAPIAVGGDYNGITNLFEFCLGYKSKKLDGKFGLIGTEFNQQQEKLWKHRYVDKVFSDKYGLAPTNDFGFLLIYKPADLIHVDFALTNGEGHKNLQSDSAFRVATGITFTFFEHFKARVYTDFMNLDDTLQSNLIAILGYSNEVYSAGVEYNMQGNSNGLDGYSRSGMSVYATYNFLKKYQLFARYDNITSNKPDGFTDNWNIFNDGSLIIVGTQYGLLNDVVISLNYRNWSPADSNSDSQSFIFMDVAINF